MVVLYAAAVVWVSLDLWGRHRGRTMVPVDITPAPTPTVDSWELERARYQRFKCQDDPYFYRSESGIYIGPDRLKDGDMLSFVKVVGSQPYLAKTTDNTAHLFAGLAVSDAKRGPAYIHFATPSGQSACALFRRLVSKNERLI